jgi:hypothetical protein
LPRDDPELAELERRNAVLERLMDALERDCAEFAERRTDKGVVAVFLREFGQAPFD